MAGIARYASKWTLLFHMRVATRASPRTPSSSWRALASCAARRPVSRKVWRCGSPSPVQVITSALPCTVVPWARMRVTVSGTSCIVLSTGASRKPVTGE